MIMLQEAPLTTRRFDTNRTYAKSHCPLRVNGYPRTGLQTGYPLLPGMEDGNEARPRRPHQEYAPDLAPGASCHWHQSPAPGPDNPLHQDAIHQFTQPPFMIMHVEHACFGGGSRGRMKADPVSRNITTLFQQISHGFNYHCRAIFGWSLHRVPSIIMYV